MYSGSLLVSTARTGTPRRRKVVMTVDESDRVADSDRSEHDQHDRPAGRDIDRSQLIHLADSFEVADVEAVDRHLLARSWAVVAEPERFTVAGGIDRQACGGSCDRRSYGDALCSAAKAWSTRCFWTVVLGDLVAAVGEPVGVLGQPIVGSTTASVNRSSTIASGSRSAAAGQRPGDAVERVNGVC